MLWGSKQLSSLLSQLFSPSKSLVFKLQLAELLSVISIYDFMTHIPSDMASGVEENYLPSMVTPTCNPRTPEMTDTGRAVIQSLSYTGEFKARPNYTSPCLKKGNPK